MNGYFGYQGAMPKEAREQLAERLQEKILGQPLPQTIGGGVSMLGAGLAAGYAKRRAAFPPTPERGPSPRGLANYNAAGPAQGSNRFRELVANIGPWSREGLGRAAQFFNQGRNGGLY